MEKQTGRVPHLAERLGLRIVPSVSATVVECVLVVVKNVIVVVALLAIFSAPLSRFEQVVLLLLALLLLNSRVYYSNVLDTLESLKLLVHAGLKDMADLAPDTEQSIKMREWMAWTFTEMDRAADRNRVVSRIDNVFSFLILVTIVWQFVRLLLNGGFY